MNLIFSPTLIVNNTLRTYPLEKAIYPVPKRVQYTFFQVISMLSDLEVPTLITIPWHLSFKFQVLFVTYTTIQRLYNQQWNESRVRSLDSANIEKYNTSEVYIK